MRTRAQELNAQREARLVARAQNLAGVRGLAGGRVRSAAPTRQNSSGLSDHPQPQAEGGDGAGAGGYDVGTDTIFAGNAFRTVTHDLGVIPLAVLATPRSNALVWVTGRTATQITFTRAGTTGDVLFDWFASGVAPPPPAPGDLVVWDHFTRATVTSPMGNADSGHLWTPLSGTWGIDTNRAYSSSWVSSAIYATVVDSGLFNCTIDVKLANVASNPGNYGLCFRATDNNNYWRWIADKFNSRLYLQKRVAGAFTTVAQVNGIAIANGHTLRVVLNGSSIDCYHNGALQASTSDAHNSSATKHGLQVAYGGTADGATQWDDFTVAI